MNKQRKVVITVTYNELGVIVDTKAEELDSSAQPATSCSEIPNGSDDTISRQAAIEALKDWYDGMIISSFRGIEKVIKALPPAQPEIIRCKDCKHRYLDGMIWNCPFGLSGGEDFFCAYGAIDGGGGT